MKVNHKLQLTVFFMGMLMLTACGGDGGSTAQNPVTQPPPVSQSLDGLWSTRCSASNNLAGYDEQDTFNFKDNTLTTTKFFYQQNTNCKHRAEALRARITANIALGEAVNPGTATGHTKIDITRTRVILAAMNNTIENLFDNTSYTGNGSIYYGYRRLWLLHYWIDLSTTTVANTNFKINQIIPDIFQISEEMVDGTPHKVLKLGAQGGNADSDNRPISLAGSITAIKQQKTIPTQTAQAAVLIGKWTYPCRIAKGHSYYPQRKSLDFEGNKLTTLIDFYSNSSAHCSNDDLIIYQVAIDADIVVGKVINKGAANEHTQIGIKTTKVQMNPQNLNFAPFFKGKELHDIAVEELYYGYGQTDWPKDVWKDISDIPKAIETLNIGTQVPDIFKISTATDGSKELKMGDYQGSFDINGRAMSLEPEGAVFQ